MKMKKGYKKKWLKYSLCAVTLTAVLGLYSSNILAEDTSSSTATTSTATTSNNQSTETTTFSVQSAPEVSEAELATQLTKANVSPIEATIKNVDKQKVPMT